MCNKNIRSIIRIILILILQCLMGMVTLSFSYWTSKGYLPTNYVPNTIVQYRILTILMVQEYYREYINKIKD